MSRHYGVPTNDFSTFSSRIAGMASAPFRLLWWIFKALLAVLLGGALSGAAGAVVVLGVTCKALFCSLFVWLGWNYGWTIAVGAHEISWVTSFWCSLPLVPFLMGSNASKSVAS